ncbi:MAG: hypothetical protein ACXQTV_03600, partial [Candidatus Hecatellaceae archaeon]
MSYVIGRYMFPKRDGPPYARTWDIFFNVTYEPVGKIWAQARETSGAKWEQVDGVQHDMGWWTTSIWKDDVNIQDFYGWSADPDYGEYDKFHGKYRCKRSVTSPENITLYLYREHRVGFPWVKIQATITPETGGSATVHYRPYWWAGDEPLRFIVPKGGSRQLLTKGEDAYLTLLGAAEDLDENWFAYWRNDRKYVAVVAFQKQPYEIRAGPNALRISFPAQTVTGGVENRLPPVFVGILKLSGDDPTGEELDVAAKLARSALTWPTGFTETFLESTLKARVKHSYTYEHYENDWNIESRPIVPVPEVYEPTDPIDFEIQGLYHRVRYVQASEAVLEAEFPAGGPLPRFTLNSTPLKPGVFTDSLYEVLDEVLAMQNPSGTWNGSPPYGDGRTMTALMLIYPKLNEAYKGRVNSAVLNCLNYHFSKIYYNAKYGVYCFENEDSPGDDDAPLVDLAATLGWFFYAIALYTHYVDGGFASNRLTDIQRLADTLEALTDWEGWCYANVTPPPHSMSETTNEAALAWLMLARILHQAGALTEKVKIRVAQTYQFIRKLAYRYQPHWDDPKLISYIRTTDVWDHIYSGKVLWNCAATIWAMWTPAMVYGGYAYDEHVENVKGHAEA